MAPVATAAPASPDDSNRNPNDPRYRRKPIGSSVSKYALATLIQPEAKDVGELAEKMGLDYQIQLAEWVISANVASVDVTVVASTAQGKVGDVGPAATPAPVAPEASAASPLVGNPAAPAATTPAGPPAATPNQGGDTSQIAARAKLLAAQLQKLWDTHLPEMLKSFREGRVAFEKVWDYSSGANLSFIRKLEPLPYAQTEMRLIQAGSPEAGANGEHAGDFDGIDLHHTDPDPKKKAGTGVDPNQRGSNDQSTVRIPVDKSWWLALDPTPLQPHGRSRFNGAPYVTWKERQEAIRLRRVLVLKMVLMGPTAHVPDEITLENGQSVDTFAAMAEAHDERTAGGMLILSNQRDRDGNYLFDVTEEAHTIDPAPLDIHIDGLDQEQLQAFGIPPKCVIEGDAVGSFAMVSQQRLILDAVIEFLLKELEESFQKYVIDKTVQMNFSPADGVKIKIGHEPLLSIPNQLVVDVVTQILTLPELPAILQSGTVDILAMLEASRIPLLPGAKEAIAKLLQTAQKQVATEQDAADTQVDIAKRQAAGLPVALPGTPGAPGTPGTVPHPGGAPAAAGNPAGNATVTPPTKPATATAAPANLSGVLANLTAMHAHPHFSGPARTAGAGASYTPLVGTALFGPRGVSARDSAGISAACNRVLSVLHSHATAHGLAHQAFGPHDDNSHTFHAIGPAGKQVHVRVGPARMGAAARVAMPENAVDIPVTHPVGRTVNRRVARAAAMLKGLRDGV